MELQVNGRDAIVSSVAFEWMLRCPWCRAVTYVSRDDGQVRLGLTASASGKTCRWYQRELPGRMPPLPAQCPACGKPDPFRGGPARNAYVTMRGSEALYLMNKAWQSFRGGFPAEAARADEVDRRGLRR